MQNAAPPPPTDADLQTLRRTVYNLQLGGDRLCAALRTIAQGCADPQQVARSALAHKAPWQQPPPPTESA